MSFLKHIAGFHWISVGLLFMLFAVLGTIMILQKLEQEYVREIKKKVYQPLPFDSHRMTYLRFPKKDYCNIIDRAIIVSGDELFSKNNKIFYYNGNAKVFIEKSKLTLLPNFATSKYINNLNIEIRNWKKETDYRKVEYEKDIDEAILTITFKSGEKKRFLYKIAPNQDIKSAGYYIVR